MDKKQETELRAQHGDIVVAKVHGKEFAFATPTDTDYEEFLQQLTKAGSDKVKIGPLFREYCLKSLVFPKAGDKPDADALEAAFRAQPASAARIADSLSDLAGASVEVTVKKG